MAQQPQINLDDLPDKVDLTGLPDEHPDEQKGMLSSFLQSISENPTAQKIGRFLSTGNPNPYSGEFHGQPRTQPITGMGNNLLSEMAHDPNESWGKYLAKGAYNQLIRPLGSAEGLLGTATKGGFTKASLRNRLDEIGNRILDQPELPSIKPQLALPPSPIRGELGTGEPLLGEPNFIGGPSNASGQIAPFDTTPDIAARVAGLATGGEQPTAGLGFGFNPDELRESRRLADLNYTAAEQYPGSRLSLPEGNTIDIPPAPGSTLGGFRTRTIGDMPYPYNVVPERLRPRAAQNEIFGRSELRSSDLTVSRKATGNRTRSVFGPKTSLSEKVLPETKPEYYVSNLEDTIPDLPSANKERAFESTYPKLNGPTIDITPTPGRNIANEISQMGEGELGYNPLDLGKQLGILSKAKAVVENSSAPDKAITLRSLVNQAGNTFKTAMASIDLSGPLRQGKGLITQPEFWKNIGPMIKMYGSEPFFKSTMQNIMEHPNFARLSENGLKLTGEHFGQQEEAFLGNWLEHIKTPGLPQTKLDPLQLYAAQVRGSDRAYTGFLNQTRFNVANKFLNTIEKTVGRAATPEEIKKITRLVNVASGRGSLGSLEPIANDLNLAFFSPRFQSSRLTMLTNPKFYADMPKGVRMEALRAGLGIAGTWLLELQLMKAAGANLITDPTNTDFGKAVFGKTRVDPGAGFGQYLVGLARFIEGKKTSSVSGKVSQFNQGYRSQSPMSLLYSSDARERGLVESKFSPLASLINDWGKGKTPDGENFQWPKAIMDRFTPMFIGDLKDLAKEHPDLLGAGIGTLGLFGEGIQTYR